MDRIDIFVGADDAVKAAIEEHRDYICGETLADSIQAADGLDTVDLNGHKTGLDVKKK